MSRLRLVAAVVVLLGGVAACGTETGAGGEPVETTGAPSEPTSGPTSGPTSEPTDPAWAAEGPAVQAAAQAFVLAVNTYGPDGLDAAGRLADYRDGVSRLLTPRFAAEFDDNAGFAEQAVTAAGVSRRAQVVSTGVADLDADTAAVLVVGSVSQTHDDVEEEPLVLRVVVALHRGAGGWLVDDFDPEPGRAGLGPGSGDLPADGVTARERAVEAAEAVLAYDYRRLDDDVARATTFLTDDYAAQYRSNVDQVIRANAPRTQTVVRADVVAAGVSEVAEDRVEVLLLVDRPTTNVERSLVSRDQATFVMVRVDGEWLLDDLTTS